MYTRNAAALLCLGGFRQSYLDERAVTLRRLAKFSECGTIGGHLILHRADMLFCPVALFAGMSLVGCRASFGRTNLFWSAERTCTALAFQTFRRVAACAVGDIHYLGHSYRAYADLFTRALNFSQSQSLRDRDLHPACVLRLSMRHQVMLMLCYSFADTLTATTRSGLAPLH